MTTLTPDDHAILEAWRKMETEQWQSTMAQNVGGADTALSNGSSIQIANLGAKPCSATYALVFQFAARNSEETPMTADIIPILTHNRSVETITVQAYAGYVVMEADDSFETVNIHIPLAALDRLLEHLHAARDDAAAMALPTRVKWLAGPAGQKAYADRLQAAQAAFLALDDVSREQAAHFLAKLGTSAAPSGSDTFGNCVRMLDERYGIRGASGLFEADLRAIVGMK